MLEGQKQNFEKYNLKFVKDPFFVSVRNLIQIQQSIELNPKVVGFACSLSLSLSLSLSSYRDGLENNLATGLEQ